MAHVIPPEVVSKRQKRTPNFTASCGVPQFTLLESTLLESVFLLPLQTFCRKNDKKGGRIRKELQRRSHLYFREQRPVLCMHVHFGDTTSAALAGPRSRNSEERDIVRVVRYFY